MSARITVDKSLIEFAIWALRKSNYLECADGLAAALSTEPGEAEPRRTFPILGSRGQTIDFALVADHGDRAQKNHYQTVARLAERGGLSWSELYAVLHNKPWAKMDENEAVIACRALEARYLAAVYAAPLPEETREDKP